MYVIILCGRVCAATYVLESANARPQRKEITSECNLYLVILGNMVQVSDAGNSGREFLSESGGDASWEITRVLGRAWRRRAG